MAAQPACDDLSNDARCDKAVGRFQRSCPAVAWRRPSRDGSWYTPRTIETSSVPHHLLQTKWGACHGRFSETSFDVAYSFGPSLTSGACEIAQEIFLWQLLTVSELEKSCSCVLDD